MKNLEYIKALISITEKAVLVMIGIVASVSAWLVNNSSAESFQVAAALLVLIMFFAGFVVSLLILLHLVKKLRV